MPKKDKSYSSPKLLTAAPPDSETSWRKPPPKLGKTVLDDLGRGDLGRSIEADIQDIYNFYLDDATRDRLKEVHPVTRVGYITFWVMKNAIFRMNPARRLMLIFTVFLFLYGLGGSASSMAIAFLGILFILFLELKDKLLAQDELAAGRVVQEALIPHESPRLDGWDVFLYTRPANDVGGDLVDYQAFDDGRIAFALGDVAGKGLGAALYMAKLQSAMRALAPSLHSPTQVVVDINEIARRDGLRDRFVSLVYMFVDPDSKVVRLSNAGHLPPIVLSDEGPRRLARGGVAVGLMDDPGYVEHEIPLDPGDTLIVYSDGVSEARNEDGDFFTEERLMTLLTRLTNLDAGIIGNRILGYLDVFVGDARQTDDLSLIVLRRKPDAEASGRDTDQT
ncbi:MAG: PP2C family protein-serine/threonine phosphatase [Rhodothermales bacterium]